MTRRYVALFALALAGAAALALLARGPRGGAAPAAGAAGPTITMTLGVYADSVLAAPAAVPVGATVELTATNLTADSARLALTGYEDRVDLGVLAPDATRRIRFLADRPGERFAWMVGDRPRGRLDVTGSHLVEGHR